MGLIIVFFHAFISGKFHKSSISFIIEHKPVLRYSYLFNCIKVAKNIINTLPFAT